MNDKVVNYVIECISVYIKNGIEEEPDKFKYTIFISELVNKSDISLSEIDDILFNKVIMEFLAYLK